MGRLDTLPRLAARLLDVIAPRTCAGCDAHVASGPWCALCRARLRPKTACALAPGLTVLGASRYVTPASRAIKALKYAGRTDLGAPLGCWLAEQWGDTSKPGDLVVPIPLHPRRLAERGYNQALLVARGFARAGRLACAPRAVLRTRDTEPQARLSGPSRRTNLVGAFTCPRAMSGARVWLLDDVVTTGATAAACAEALTSAGASVQGVLCLGISLAPDRGDDDAELI